VLEPQLPPRIIHLSGGLVAHDNRSGGVSVSFKNGPAIFGFTSKEYTAVYQQLASLEFNIVGVEFATESKFTGRFVPDWQAWNPAGGFTALQELRAWGEIRTAAINDRNLGILSVAARFKTYIELLQLRLFDYSACYNDALNAWRLSGSRSELMRRDGFLTRIDAATHAFVADAAAFRDLLVEAIWLLVLKEAPNVTQIGSFLKATRSKDHPLVQTIHRVSASGDWLGKFSSVRNDITHVAPVGQEQIFHSYQVRERQISGKYNVPSVHYPLLQQDGSLQKASDDFLDYDDEELIESALQKYRDYCDSSLDGLNYIQSTAHNLLALSSSVRSAAQLRGEMIRITDDDIIGPVKFL
jgi:hypothetical protein